MKVSEFRFASPAAAQRTAFVLAVLFLFLLSYTAMAAPGGPTLVSSSTNTGPVQDAYSRADAKGTITTINYSFTQQNNRWKAYIGNISGAYSLRDSTNATIYSWNFSASSGEIYATRAVTVIWANISCATLSNISAEDTVLSHATANTDTILKTFDMKVHNAFSVGSVAITANTCNSTVTYVNNVSNPSTYRELLMWDNASAFVYTSLLNYSQTGYNGGKYDFQMMVAEDDTASTPKTYYFYVELL